MCGPCVNHKLTRNVTTLTLGSRQMQRFTRVRAKREAWECRRVWRNESSHSQASSHFGSWSLDGFPNFQRVIAWVKTHWIESFLISLKKLLDRKCLKWACMTHLDISSTSYGQMKGRESNRQFDSRPLKVGNLPDFLTCRWCETYRWKAFDEGYNFALDLISIGGLQIMLRAPKVARIPTLRKFRDSHLGVPRQNAIWVLISWPNTKYTIRGKVVASPKLGPWWIVWIQGCPWFVLTPKVFKLCTNQLVVWFV
jgi:hypothetical protein